MYTFREKNKELILSLQKAQSSFLLISVFLCTLRILIICHLCQLFCPILWFAFILLIMPFPKDKRTTVFVKIHQACLLWLLALGSCQRMLHLPEIWQKQGVASQYLHCPFSKFKKKKSTAEILIVFGMTRYQAKRCFPTFLLSVYGNVIKFRSMCWLGLPERLLKSRLRVEVGLLSFSEMQMWVLEPSSHPSPWGDFELEARHSGRQTGKSQEPGSYDYLEPPRPG